MIVKFDKIGNMWGIFNGNLRLSLWKDEAILTEENNTVRNSCVRGGDTDYYELVNKKKRVENKIGFRNGTGTYKYQEYVYKDKEKNISRIVIFDEDGNKSVLRFEKKPWWKIKLDRIGEFLLAKTVQKKKQSFLGVRIDCQV